MQDDHIKAVKTHASILIESLKPHGVALKKTEALEIISKLQSRLDWNRLRARLKTPAQAKPPLPATDQLADAMILVGGRWRKKTEILKTLFELECAEGVTSPIMISIAGSGHTFGQEADIFFSGLSRLTVIYDSAGIVNVDSSSNSYGKGLLVNLVSSEKGTRSGAGYALSQLLNCHRADLKQGIRWKLGSLLIDDLQQITDELELAEAAVSIRDFAQSYGSTFRRLVVTSEFDVPKNCQKLLGMKISYLVDEEYARPPYAIPEQVIRVLNSNSEFNLSNWRSLSLADRDIVADVCWWVWFLDKPRNRGAWENGKSRAAIVPGTSLWFSDLRASLIR